MKRLLIITYYWPPSGGAGVQRWLKFTKYLPEFGWEPVILTVDPDYASYAQIDKTLNNDIAPNTKVFRTKTFELYSIYRFLSKKKEIPYGGGSNEDSKSLFNKFARFVRGNFFIPDPRRGWKRYAVKKALEIISEFNITDIITTGPPHSTHLIGLELKKRLNIRWVADFRDPWTDIYYYKEFAHTRLVQRIDKRLEKRVLENADNVITVSNDLERILMSKIENPLGINKFHVIHNGYDESDFNGIKSTRTDKSFTITYTGTISDTYDMSGFIQALTKVCKYHSDKIVMQFVGNVPDNIISIMTDLGLKKNLKITGYIPHSESINRLINSNLLLLVIPKVKNNKGIITGKLFEYLASLKPILCIAPEDGDAASIIKECNAGKTVEYSKVNEMKEYIMSTVNKKDYSYNSGLDNYSRKNLTHKLTRILEENK
jgi:glycosyltransferase involved in cell wall biosynthesis